MVMFFRVCLESGLNLSCVVKFFPSTSADKLSHGLQLRAVIAHITHLLTPHHSKRFDSSSMTRILSSPLEC